MSGAYIKLGIAALLPVLAAGVLYALDRKTRFGSLNRWKKQVLIGVVFGALAIVGTEWGIPMNGAQVNCRDAAVLSAGLLFGGPAGIIAGLIGGLERWVAVAWGVGTFTRVACTVSTIVAGFYAAVLRRYMFEEKKPGWLIAFATGVVMEVFHLTMVFVTNMGDTEKALAVVKACSAPMIIANGLSVMLAAMLLSIVSGERILLKLSEVRISQTIQRWLLVVVVLAFAVTTGFVALLQTRMAEAQTASLLELAATEVTGDLLDSSDRSLVAMAYVVAEELSDDTLSAIAERHHIREINIVDQDGVITDSTEERFIGFDMNGQSQSAEFLCLLGYTSEYVQKYGPIAFDDTVQRKYAGVKIPGGFLQLGYDAQGIRDQLKEEVKGITKNRHVGETGAVFILNEVGDVLSGPSGFDGKSLKKDISVTGLEQGVPYAVSIGGEEGYCACYVTEGFYILPFLPRAEAFTLCNIAIWVNVFMEILVFALLFGAIYLLIKRVVVNQLTEVNYSLAKITGGDLDEVVRVRTNQEFASLSDDINSTVDTLKRYIAEASARIDAELEFAKEIQASALPSVFPAFPGQREFDIYASMNPAKEVGGDFYDFYMTGSDHLHFLVADVSGKGIPASLFMMRAKTELKTLTDGGYPIGEVFTTGNDALCEGNDAGMFVTAWQGDLDLTTGLVRYANAGHNPPVVRHQDGRFTYLKGRVGFVLAGMEGVRYRPQEIQLEPGDVLYLYTDGVTEATNGDEELYGEERLLTALNSREFSNMEELCRFVKADVDAFVGEAPQFDDITMVAVRYDGPSANTI